MNSSPRRTATSLLQELVGRDAIRVPWDTGIDVAWDLFIERALTAAPVVDRDGRPVGTVYRGDLAAAVLDDEPTQPGAPPTRRPAGDAFRRPSAVGHQSVVADLMRAELSTVPLSATIDQARAQLESSGAAQLVVVDPYGAMVGTLRARDLRGA